MPAREKYRIMCKSLVEQAKEKKSKGLSQQVQELKADPPPLPGSIENKKGTVLIEEKVIKKRWLEYSKHLYKEGPDVMQTRTELGTEPLVCELEKATKKESNDTRPGLDLFPMELPLGNQGLLFCTRCVAKSGKMKIGIKTYAKPNAYQH